MAKVDVLIPTFNRGAMLKEAVQSILRQTMSDFRILIWDDGSTDGSTDPKALPSDPRIVVLNRGGENQGIAHARTQLLAAVEAPFACWQDSDDLSSPDRLMKMLAHLEKSGADIAFSYIYFFNGNVTRKHWHLRKVDTSRYGPAKPGFGLDGNMTHPTAMFRRCLCRYPVPDIGRAYGTDRFWLVSLIQAGVKFSHLTEPLYFLRRHPSRVTKQRRGG